MHKLEVMPKGGGKTCLYKNFGGAKALFCYVNLQIIGSAGMGKAKLCKSFHLESNAPVLPFRYVPGSYGAFGVEFVNSITSTS